jgi:ligand-binding sensor domain-containing protein
MALYRQDDGLADDHVNDVAVDGAGVVWVATDGGVSRLDPSAGRFTTLEPPDWAGSSTVSAVYIDASGTKWFGTATGVVRYTAPR